MNYSLLLIDIRNLPRKKMNNLGRRYPFHGLNIKDCFLKTLPMIDKYDNYIFVILHFFPTGTTDDKILRVTQLLINKIYGGVDISLPGSQLNQFQFLGKYTTTLILVTFVSIIIADIMFIAFHRLG